MMKLDFSSKIVLVTASSQGIGFGIAKAFCQSGAKVCISSRDASKVGKAEMALKSLGVGHVLAITGDIGDASALQNLVERTEDYFKGSIDILINNSGGPPANSLLELTEDDWKNSIDRNLLSVIRLSRLVSPGMKKKSWGRIINLTSIVAREPAPDMGLSNVTRAGVAAFSKTLAHELGPNGITVNTILTGGCKTERFYQLAKRQAEKTGVPLEETVAQMDRKSPVRHISSPEEFSHTVLFIASEEASYLNGTAIALDGGASMSIF